jgi:hypothetical protein
VPPKHGGQLWIAAVLTGEGSDENDGELEALTDLSIKLRELRAAELRTTREKRSRAAYLQGAEEDSRATLGRPLTSRELERVLRRYPGV